jgi:hypothetical protein
LAWQIFSQADIEPGRYLAGQKSKYEGRQISSKADIYPCRYLARQIFNPADI